ncbi:MAG TPA: HesA/MoeB/ThiF family protein [Gammaproteobacteria bacterium]|nr:HesA/MoeB/ThiF family protein [Gammaproteobacteria bacterium]
MKITNISLSDEELKRYSRQLSLSQIGMSGQKKIKNAKVLCVGAGGLGSAALIYLAGAGVGTIGIIDDDQVELNNLHRQIIYNTQQINMTKPEAAKERIQAINPNINVITYNTILSDQNALDIIDSYDIVIDGTDNFTAKYLINDACIISNKPNIFATIYQFQGQCSIFTRAGPCYRCLYPIFPENHTPNCAQAGVLGSLPGLLGTIQAIETIKLIVNTGYPLIGEILTIDVLSMQFKKHNIKQNPSCKMHHKNIEKHILKQTSSTLDSFCTNIKSISARNLKKRVKEGIEIQLVDVRQKHEHQVYNIGGKAIPLNELEKRINELNPTQEVIVYCQTDQRSKKAAKTLISLGFNSVLYLKGGIISY